MKVFIDSREATTIKLLRKICEPKVVKLPLGDVVIAGVNGALVVERKTVSDFISSIRSNRLWSQLLALMKAQEVLGYQVRRRLLVIHGGFWEHTNVSQVNEEKYWSSNIGALLAVNFVYDTPTIVCENNHAFEVFLRILLQRELKGKNDRLPEARWYKKPLNQLPTKDARRYVLDAIPTIGEERAKSLLDSYGTILNVAKSAKSDLMKVPGIGEKRAEKIYEVFH
jgi:ERCC4-type nuclease